MSASPEPWVSLSPSWSRECCDRAVGSYSGFNSLADSVKAVEQKHASEWKALYLAQSGDSPSVEIPGKSENATRFVEVPGGRLALPQKLRVSSGVAVGLLLHKVEPEFPQEAKIAHVQGDVVLQELISKEGDVTELHLVSGHPLLVKAAMDAVKQWQYKPYLLNGYPVEVETTVVIRFHM